MGYNYLEDAKSVKFLSPAKKNTARLLEGILCAVIALVETHESGEAADPIEEKPMTRCDKSPDGHHDWCVVVLPGAHIEAVCLYRGCKAELSEDEVDAWLNAAERLSAEDAMEAVAEALDYRSGEQIHMEFIQSLKAYAKARGK